MYWDQVLYFTASAMKPLQYLGVFHVDNNILKEYWNALSAVSTFKVQ